MSADNDSAIHAEPLSEEGVKELRRWVQQVEAYEKRGMITRCCWVELDGRDRTFYPACEDSYVGGPEDCTCATYTQKATERLNMLRYEVQALLARYEQVTLERPVPSCERYELLLVEKGRYIRELRRDNSRLLHKVRELKKGADHGH